MRVGLLGPLEISEDGRRFSITSAKQRGLIALLALNAGSVVSANRLIDGLCGEGAGGDALSALRHHVSRLRTEIGSTLVTRASGYLLDLEPDHVDALQFARLGATWAGTLLNPGGEGVLFMPVLVGTGVVALGLWGVRMSPGYGNDSCIFDPLGQSADMPAKPDSKITLGLPSPMHDMCNR
jgi:hypothetical protein